MTRHAYDPVNFRLLRQKTEGYSLSGLTYTPSSGSTKQDCAYTYDLAGNILGMTDASPSAGIAGPSGPFSRGFEYDALYRLLKATGREAGSHVSSSDPNFMPTPDDSVGGTVGYYREYTYDKLGNMLDLYHHGGMGNQFHRVFNSGSSNPYELGNLATDIEYAGTVVDYTFDANGNMLTEGLSRAFEWDFGDRMRGFAEGTIVAAYLYDAGGNRVKKLVWKSDTLQEVTVYIDGGFEYIYNIVNSSKAQEMNEVHVMDGRSRIARVREYLSSTWSGAAPEPVLYNLEDHLGNASFSLTATGAGYSREEYFPFGETSFGSFARKRYRFCGKERDEESGLYYYGARYYAAWSCRFVSIDPLAGDYPFYTPYQYAGNKPIVSIDIDGLEGNNDTGGQSAESGNPEGEVGPSGTHTVEKGDTFWDLAQKSGGKFTVHNLRDWNPGVDPEKLQIGQHINVAGLGYEWSSMPSELKLVGASSESLGQNSAEVKSESDFVAKHGVWLAAKAYTKQFFTTRTASNLRLDIGGDLFNIPRQNTFRHAYGSAVLVAEWGEEVATDAANAHEKTQANVLETNPNEARLAREGFDVVIPIDILDSFVDQLNNIAGRRIGLEMKGSSASEIAERILWEMSNGKLFSFSYLDKTHHVVHPSELPEDRYYDAMKALNPFDILHDYVYPGPSKNAKD